MGLLGGSKSKISKSLLEEWRGTSPYPFLDHKMTTSSFCGGGTFITFLKINIFQFRFLGRSRGVSCTLWITETRKIYIYTVKKVPPPQNDESFCGQKRGFSPILGEVNFFFLVSMVLKVHDTPLDLPKKWNWKIFIL